MKRDEVPRGLSGIAIRRFRPGDEDVFQDIILRSFSELEYVSGIRKLTPSSGFDPQSFFFAEEDGVATGCVGVFKLYRPNWLEIAYLAVSSPSSRRTVAEHLARKAVEHADSIGPEFLMASTLAVQPYVDIYKSLGFRPVRRILRIAWDLLAIVRARKGLVEIRDLREDEKTEASHVFVKASKPYWDWWIEEKGGDKGVVNYLQERMKQKTWICAIVDGSIVGLARVSPDNYAPQEAGFWGVYVLPEFRERGIGSALMSEALTRARQAGQRRLVVFTVAAFDSLLPGVLLYLRNAGRIEAEYLHLIMK